MLVKAKPYFLCVWLVSLLIVWTWNQRGAVLAAMVMAVVALGANYWPGRQPLKKIISKLMAGISKPILLILISLTVWSGLSLIWRDEVLPMHPLVLNLFAQLCVFILAVNHVRENPQTLPVWPLFILFGLVSMVFVYISWGDTQLEATNILARYYNRIFVTMALLSIPFAAMIYLRSGQGRLGYCITLFSALVWIPMSFWTTSQTAQLVWLVCWPMLAIILLVPAKIGRLVSYSMVAVPLAMPVFVGLLGGLLQILEPYGLKLVQSSSSGLRLEIWKTTVNLIAERPFWGWGINSFEAVMPHAQSALIFKENVEGNFTHPHNAFLQVWLDLGLVGVLIVTALIASVAKAIDRMPQTLQPFAIVALLAVVIVSAISHAAWQGWWISSLVLLVVFFVGLSSPKLRLI